MEALKNYTVRQLEELLRELMEEYRGYQARGLALDMSRGKPNTDQLDLCQGMLDTVSSSLGAVSGSGVDCRNYGLLEGLVEDPMNDLDRLGGESGVAVLLRTEPVIELLDSVDI